MRIHRITTALAAAGLASLALVGCGSQTTGTGATPGSAGGTVRPVGATASPSATATAQDTASLRRFTKVVRAINNECRVTPPGRPSEFPESDAELVDGGYGPDNPPPTQDGIGPDPDSSEGPPVDYNSPLEPRDYTEVPLDAEIRCITGRHADRIREGLGGKGVADAQALRAALLKLDYPASRVHAMPARGGAPVVRVDLRIDSQAALEIVGGPEGPVIEPFGAVADPDLRITEVKRG
ncbi:hypothetical protein AB0G79_23545 [Streptomyces sp. NPDC020807]|uniref:hypothetical protein n=1 Tax=Streptomyces sp. NPDC020807 TaxID=3155119 RepID=UPI00340AC3E3